MSKTQCVYPQVGCLVAAEEILGEYRVWNPVNEKQKKFIKEVFNYCREEVKEMSDLESMASWDVSAINNFLKEKRFDIQLDDFKQPGEFGAASVLDVLVHWLNKGKHIKWKTPKGKEFDAAKLSKDTVKFYEAEGHPYPIAKLLTKEDDHVYMTVMDKEPKQLDLISIASKLQKSCNNIYHQFNGLIFPCIDYDEKVDISWLKGMITYDKDNREWFISQALQQTKLRMNEKGARAQSAAAVGVRLTAALPEEPYVIDKPFLTWFERHGLSNPLIVGYMTEKDWKRPASLD